MNVNIIQATEKSGWQCSTNCYKGLHDLGQLEIIRGVWKWNICITEGIREPCVKRFRRGTYLDATEKFIVEVKIIEYYYK